MLRLALARAAPYKGAVLRCGARCVAGGADGAALLDTLHRCTSLYADDVAPVNEALRGPLEADYAPTMLPFVLLLGNHSSGKSSFANLALGRDVQTAGVAPTDDGFTVIAPGSEDADRDGPALVSDPSAGFSGLRAFGPGLVNHLSLKVRAGVDSSDFMIVDSPGMIDAPGQESVDDALSRGYDFEKAVKWFADRADVVLLFFDPDKPGTTGETLRILTNALGGADHKLHIVLNKADKFERIHDFARAYGALCWNLSKVIPRKDLPRIHTMCVQTDAEPRETFLRAGLEDLHRTRDEVLREARRAPSRRIDNAITRLGDAAALLLMHAEICGAARKRASGVNLRRYGATALAALGAAGAAGALAAAGALPAAAGAALLGGAGTAGLHYASGKTAAEQLAALSDAPGLDGLYREAYAAEIARGDEESAALWRRSKDHLLTKLGDLGGAANVPAPPRNATRALRRILDVDVPALRRESAPPSFASPRAPAPAE